MADFILTLAAPHSARESSNRIASTADHLQIALFERQNALGTERDLYAAGSVPTDNGQDPARDPSVGLSELGMPPVRWWAPVNPNQRADLYRSSDAIFQPNRVLVHGHTKAVGR